MFCNCTLATFCDIKNPHLFPQNKENKFEPSIWWQWWPESCFLQLVPRREATQIGWDNRSAVWRPVLHWLRTILKNKHSFCRRHLCIIRGLMLCVFLKFSFSRHSFLSPVSYFISSSPFLTAALISYLVFSPSFQLQGSLEEHLLKCVIQTTREYYTLSFVGKWQDKNGQKRRLGCWVELESILQRLIVNLKQV